MNDDPDRKRRRPPGGKGPRPPGGKAPPRGKGAPRDRFGKPGGTKPANPQSARPRPAQRETAPAEEERGERIARRLARAGLASRREAESLIAAGRVSVNGRVLSSPAFNVAPGDTILVDGAPLPPIERTRLFLFHKPAGLVTTNRDPEGRRTIFDALPKDLPRVMTVGRLDIATEGLLLLTNDGGLARMLELPATGWLRRYRVRVHGKVDPVALAGLAEGIAVDGVYYGGVEATLDREQGSNAWLTIGLREGKNREVRNILGALGLEVTRLIRVSYGPFQLGDLAEGAVQEIRGRMLRDQLGERLIREAGANFDAPVNKPFSNSPVKADEAPKPERATGTPRPDRKKTREFRREDALSRLDTRPRAFSPRRKEEEAEARDKPGRRLSNVWMAPGARPTGRKKPAPSAEPPAEKPAGRREAPSSRPARAGAGERSTAGRDERRGKPGDSFKPGKPGEGFKPGKPGKGFKPGASGKPAPRGPGGGGARRPKPPSRPRER